MYCDSQWWCNWLPLWSLITLQLKGYIRVIFNWRAIKLQRGNQLHHHWLSQYIKGIRSCYFWWPSWIIGQSQATCIFNWIGQSNGCFSSAILNFLTNHRAQGSHRHWKTWKNETTFSSQGKVRRFWKNGKKSGKSQGILNESGKSQGKLWFIN